MAVHTCDDLVLGSSPVSVLEAVALARRGRRVVVAEAEPTIGGVWRPVTVGDQVYADQAPHLIDARPGIYEFLEDELGVELVDVSRDAYVAFAKPIFGRRLFPYSEYWLHKMYNGNDREIFRALSDAGHEAETVSSRVYGMLAERGDPENRQSTIKYFKGGTQALVRRLDELLQSHGVGVLTNHRVSALAYDSASEQWTSETESASVVSRSVVMNTHAFPEAVTFDGETVSLERTERPAHSLFLTIENTPDYFFYAVFPESPLVYLAADVGYSSSGQSETTRVVSVTLNNMGVVKFGRPDAICRAVVEDLRGSGLISRSSNVASVDLLSLRRGSLAEPAISHVTQLPGLRCVSSGGGLDVTLMEMQARDAKLAA